MTAVTLDDVRAAAARLDGHAVRTPLLENPALNERVGGRLLIKPETLQKVGAFKFRGAYNRLSQLSDAEKTRGVVAFSSGNHAQGVALAARMLGVPAVIVMPTDAPAAKIAATRGYGAEVITYDRYTEDREAIARNIADERGSTTVPPYDDVHIIAGQGTLGLEIVEQARALGAEPQLVATPLGGGGLVSGVAIAVKGLIPDAELWGAEPEGFDDIARSLASGEMQGNIPGARSICDALQPPAPGKLTYPIIEQLLTGVVAVSDAEVAEAVRAAFNTLKLVVEPGGAAALAGVISGKIPLNGRTGVVVLSGGNVDPALYARILAGEL
jgi:threonine dehydratase